ncbi:MAG: HPr family phosphocarrier protein [Clostridia bacterium]|nr:HPr family phosphocarrier protein [Clostridia bacterium]
MKQFSYMLTRAIALHAGTTNKLMREASRFSSSIRLMQEDREVDLRNAHARLSARSGSRITVTVEGRDEEAAVAAIQNYVVANM